MPQPTGQGRHRPGSPWRTQLETEKRQQRGKFDRAREKIEGSDAAAGKHDEDMPAAGPHARDGATNAEATPGAGALPSPRPTDDVEPGTG